MIDLAHRVGYRVAYRLLQAWWFCRRPAGHGAAVAVWSGDRLLVVRTSYRRHLDLPGGGIERLETPLMAAVRELREETGLLAPPEELSDAGSFRFDENHRRITTQIFRWRPVEPPTPSADHREIVWARYMSRDQLAQAELSPALELYLAAGDQVPSGTRQMSRA